jgi:hypothetical protein
MMFLLNVGNTWTLATELDDVAGAVFLASGNPHTRFARRARPDLQHVLLDPQLHLAGLDVRHCGKVCGRLATHPWFLVDGVPQYESEDGVKAWQKIVHTAAAENWTGRAPVGDDVHASCVEAIKTQVEFGCSQVILPCPMLDEREDAGGVLGAWLDESLDAAETLEVGQPLLATVAVSQHTLNEEAFDAGGFLDALVDQVSARKGLAGVYIVVALYTSPGHPFETPGPVLKAYLQLTQAFREAGCGTVMVNFADVFGFACVAAGATNFATGESQTRRRLCMNAFRDQGGGLALPYLYSHQAFGEFASESDLNPIIKARLVNRIKDETAYSDELFEQIAMGNTAADVAQWAESQNNIAAAQRHFITRMALEGEALGGLSRKKRASAVRDALDAAESTELLLTKRLKRRVGRYAPVSHYIELLDE